MTPRILLLSVFIGFFAVTGNAQLPHVKDKKLFELVKDKQTIGEVMTIVEKWYSNEEKYSEFENDYLKWKRWEMNMLRTAGPFGSFGDINKSLIDLWKTDPFHGNGANNPNSTTPNWTFTGPRSSTYGMTPPSGFNGIGRCDKIAFHPTDPNIIYVGAPLGGLWRTMNGGTSWNVLTSYLPISGVSGIVVSYADPNTLYILSGNGDEATFGSPVPTAYTSAGVFKSTDAGVTWTQMTVPWPSTIGVGGFQLVQSPRNPNTLMMATTYGLFRTINGGDTWSTLYTLKCFDVEYVRNSDTCYAAINSTSPLKRSINDGANWTNVSFGPAPGTPIPVSFNRMQLAVSTVPVSAGGNEIVYLFCGPVTGPGVFSGLYKMAPGNFMTLARNTPNLYGRSASGTDANDQSGYDNCAAVHPTNANVLVTGGLVVFRTTDGASTMPQITFYSEVETASDLTKYIHPDIHDLAFNPLNNYLYAATDGGVYRTTNNGVSWTDITLGITTSMFYDIDGFAGNEYALLGGLQDNGNKYRETNTSDMLHIGCCDGFYGKISPSNSSIAYASANQWLFRYDALPGTAATGIEPPIGQAGWAWRMMSDQVDGTYVYTSHSNTDSIWVSNNSGASWFKRRKANGNRLLVTCPSNLNRVYAAGSWPIWDLANTTLKRSDDKGETWSVNLLTSPGLPAPLQSAPSDLEVNPFQSVEAFMSFQGLIAGQKVYRSIDAGASWVNISYNLPNVPVNALAVDDAIGVYAGTDYGVFYKPAGATAWIFYGNNLPRVPVSDLYLNRTFDVLYAATYGRGIWKTNTYAACDPLLVFSGTQAGEKVYEAQNTIWSWAEVEGGKQTKVFYKSGDSIKLINGFIAREDITEFKATLGPCGTGYPPLSNISDTTQIILHKLSLPTTVTSAHPFGAFTIVKGDQQQVETNLSILKEGDFELRLTDKLGNFISQLQKKEKWTAGKANRAYNFSRLPKDLYYIHLIYNGTLVHFQELDLR